MNKKILYLVSSVERRILTQERVVTRIEATRSRVKIRSARDKNNFFVPCIPIVSRVRVVLPAESLFSRTSAVKF